MKIVYRDWSLRANMIGTVMCKEKVAVPEGAKPIYPNFCKGASRCARLTTGPLLRRFKNISVEETADYNDWSLTNLG